MSQEIETRISQCNQKLRSVFEEQDEINPRFKIRNKRRLIFMNGKVEAIVYLIEY